MYGPTLQTAFGSRALDAPAPTKKATCFQIIAPAQS